jgi:hypothetical protein
MAAEASGNLRHFPAQTTKAPLCGRESRSSIRFPEMDLDPELDAARGNARMSETRRDPQPADLIGFSRPASAGEDRTLTSG